MVEIAEAQANTFIHPLTDQVVGYSEHLNDIEKLRLICDPRYLPEFNDGVFSTYFPNSFEIKQKFNPDTTYSLEETMLTQEEKNIRRIILETDFGYTTPKKANRMDATFLPHLHVAYTEDPNSFVRRFNRIPEIVREQDTYQTSLDSRGNRYSHTQHLMHWVVLDILRLSMHQPELFEEKYISDMKEYQTKFKQWHGVDTHFSLEPSPEQYDQMVQRYRAEYGQTLDEEQLLYRARITCIGVNEAKIALLGTGEHDSETPGFCDLFMKSPGSGLLQAQPDGYYSEDQELADRIWSKTHSNTALAAFIHQEGLDPDLIATMIRSTALENDTCLPGLLYKDKRSGLEKDPDKAHLALGQVLDLDQLSGTVTNMEIMCTEFLPGGFDPHISKNRHPRFSFDARLMILHYAMLSHMDKDKLAQALEKLDIDPKDIFIAAEEISYGQNTSLTRVNFGDKEEIMPIPVVPGQVKRTLEAIDVMYAGFYLHPSKETVVELFKNMITSWVYLDIDRSLDFVHRTKNETLDVMKRLNPVMVFFESFDQRFAGILTFDELHRELETQEHMGITDQFYLAKKVHMKSALPNKKGTLVRDEKRTVQPAMDLLRKYRGTENINPNSYPERHDKLESFYGIRDYVMKISLTKDEVLMLQNMLQKMRPDLRKKMISVFDQWTKDISENGQNISNPIREFLVEPFLSDGNSIH